MNRDRVPLAIVWKLRRVLSGLESLQGLEMFVDRSVYRWDNPEDRPLETAQSTGQLLTYSCWAARRTCAQTSPLPCLASPLTRRRAVLATLSAGRPDGRWTRRRCSPAVRAPR